MANHQKRSSGRQPADSTVADLPQDNGADAADAAPVSGGPSESGRPAKAPSLNINDLKDMSIQKLTQVAKDLNVAGATGMRKQDLIFQILRRDRCSCCGS